MTEKFEAFILERKGCPIHYWIGGQAGAPLVVFTHGLCVDHRSWDPITPQVGEKYRVLVWDVRGHGLSQPMGEEYNLSLGVEDLLAILAQLEVGQAVFVGHSNGTYIGQELAFRYPEKVQALVIADGTCITWEHSAFENWITRNAWRMMTLFPYETLKKSSLPYVSTRKDVQDYTYEAYSMLSRADFLTLNRALGYSLHFEPGYHIQKPVLLIHGDQDRMGDIAKISPVWAVREPGCRYEVIPNARHFAPLDQPEVFTRLLMDFLVEVSPVEN